MWTIHNSPINKSTGENGRDVLPAIMITTIHPSKFKEKQSGYRFSDIAPGSADDRIVLIPLQALCNATTEVVALQHTACKLGHRFLYEGRRNECLEPIGQTYQSACWWRLKPVSQPTWSPRRS